MRSQQILVTRIGPREAVEAQTVDVGPPPPGQAVVRVEAAGVFYGDILLRTGVIPGGPKPPFVPGHDVVGVVEQVGDGVTAVVPGQPVAALLRAGRYSQRLSVPAERLVPRPEGAAAIGSAAVALNDFIAYQMLHRVAALRAGDHILVHGASGGVGTAFLQLGRLAGIQCYGTAMAAKQELVRRFGGHPIDYRHQDFGQVIRGLPGGAVDAVFDAIGGPRHFRRSHSVPARGGILVAYAQSAALVDGKASRRVGGWGSWWAWCCPSCSPVAAARGSTRPGAWTSGSRRLSAGPGRGAVVAGRRLHPARARKDDAAGWGGCGAAAAGGRLGQRQDRAHHQRTR
jgi:NADPH:quinone reductase-like Zn-dependent oxidoreductase